MPTPTIPAGNLFMNATLYTGNGTSQTITNGAPGASFQPDLVWGKNRSNIANHGLVDSVRGISTWLGSNSTAAENTVADSYVTAFNSNGFTAGLGGVFNASGDSYVAWQWKAGGTAVSNTAGSITSSVSANTTSGFSIVTYTGNLTTTGTATVGHGLGVAPAMIIFKGRNATTSWPVFHTSLTSWSYSLFLEGTNAQTDQSSNGTLNPPTSTVFSTNWTTGMNTNGTTEVAYCFAPVAGYSAFGSYTGNGSADGPFIYTGFRPRWFMIKATDVESWELMDTSRSPYNQAINLFEADSASAEAVTSVTAVDFLSNGFKLRNTRGAMNGSGRTYTYSCFAENPFKYANAR